MTKDRKCKEKEELYEVMQHDENKEDAAVENDTVIISVTIFFNYRPILGSSIISSLDTLNYILHSYNVSVQYCLSNFQN